MPMLLCRFIGYMLCKFWCIPSVGVDGGINPCKLIKVHIVADAGFVFSRRVSIHVYFYIDN